MKNLQPLLIFTLAFLFAIEIFLLFNIDARLSFILPIAAVFALLAVAISKPIVHWYKMLFDDQYNKHYKSSKRHHSKHRSHAKAA